MRRKVLRRKDKHENEHEDDDKDKHDKHEDEDTVLTGYESPPVLYEFFDLRLIYAEVSHHHSRVVAKPQNHKPLLRVAFRFRFRFSR